MIRSKITCLLLAVALCGTGQARAATFCATTSEELQAALDAAKVNGQADIVRIAKGYYRVPPGGFVYDSVTPVDGDDHAIAIMGGWTALAGEPSPCGQLLREDPWLTELDGDFSDRVLHIEVRPNSWVLVSLLTFSNGHANGSERGGGLLLGNNGGHYAGQMYVERNVFLGNTAHVGGGLRARNATDDDGRLYVLNNLFVQNHARSNGGAAELGLNQGQTFFTNNTVLLNTSDGETPIGGINASGNGEFVIANNNLWDNEVADLNLSPAIIAGLYNNNIGVRSGDEPENESGNIGVEPEYENGSPGFTPKRTSPLVDAGIAAPESWYLTELDLNAAARVVGPAVDIGAYENERIFSGNFEEPGTLGIGDPAQALRQAANPSS